LCSWGSTSAKEQSARRPMNFINYLAAPDPKDKVLFLIGFPSQDQAPGWGMTSGKALFIAKR
jgi:hypothetical protein